jgi:hypothetical protein
MFQQLIAITIIGFFLIRLIIQKRREKIGMFEFLFTLVFWVFAAIAVANIRLLDKFVAKLGFSGSGIQILLYLAIAVLFYFVFRLRLRIERMERDITEIVRSEALKNKNIVNK